jgi:hypothetical protein
MKILHITVLILIALLLTACPLENERPPEEILPLDLPELPVSVIQIPLTLKSRHLRRAFYQQFPNPLLVGETTEFEMQLATKERKEEDKNFFNRVTDPILGWVDKTIHVSSQLLYEVDLSNYNFWFEEDRFYADIVMDLRTNIKLKNGISILGNDLKLNGSLNCPIEVRMVLEGNIELTKDARINIIIDNDNAKIKFQKICSSNAIKGIDIPKLLRPILEPLKERISQSINKMIANQLQQMLDNNSENLSFKSKIEAASKQLGQPYELMEEVWLVPQVQEIFVSPVNGTGKGFKNQLEISIGVKAKPIVLMTKEQPKVKIHDKVNFAIETYEPGTNIYVSGKIPLTYAANELQVFLKEYIDDNYSKHGYTIGKTSIYPSEKKVVVAIDVLKVKSLKEKATIYLWGLPKYDNATQEIYLEDLAFTAKSKNIILKFAQWFSSPKIMKRLTENTRFELSEKLKEFQNQLNDFELEDGMGTLTGKFNYVNVSEVFVSKTDFEIYFEAQGNLDFDIKW